MKKILNKENVMFIMNSPLLFSLIINLLFFITFFMFGSIKYEVSDDFIMQMIVSGGYTGVPSPEIVFMNIAIGYVLSFLYSICHTINWYFWFQVLISFISLWMITYCILKKYNNFYFKTVVFCFLCFFSNDIYLLMQFTKTATLTIIASFLLYFFNIFEEKINKKEIALASCLFFIGICIRYRSLYICLPFYGILWLVLCFNNRDKIKTIFKRSILVLMACSLCIIVNRTNTAIYKNMNPEYKEYVEYNDVRSSIVDYTCLDYSYYQDEFEKISFTETDYNNLIHWGFIDQNVYTQDKLKSVSNIIQKYRNQHPVTFKDVIKTFLEKKYWFYVSVIGVVCIFLLGLLRNRKILNISFIFLGLTLIILYSYIAMGRLIYRIEYSTFLSLATALMYFMTTLTDQMCSIKKVLVGLNVGMIVLRVPVYFHDTQRSHEIMYPSYYNSVKKYNCTFNKENIQYDLMNEFESHLENIYFLEFQTMIQSYYLNFSPLEAIEPGRFKNAIYISGVDTNHSTWKKILNEYNITNPAEALLEDNVYLVDNKNVDNILMLLNEQNDGKVVKTLYKEVNGFKIWKFKLKG